MNQELYLTLGGGDSWKFLADYVQHYTWGHNDQKMVSLWPSERIVISHNPQGKGNQERFRWTEAMEVRMSDDFFNTS